MHELNGQELLEIDGGRKVNLFAGVIANSKDGLGAVVNAYAEATGKYFSKAGTMGITIANDSFAAGVSLAFGVAF